METKICSNVHCEKDAKPQPIEAFYVNKGSKDGRSSRCKVCSREYAKMRSNRIHEEFNELKRAGLLKDHYE